WQTSEKGAAGFNSKAMNAIFNAVSMEEFKRISNVEVAHIAWKILQTVHEGTKAVKINKLQQLTSRFESIRMSDDESFDEFYAKLNDIVNSAFNLGEIYDQPKIVRKILRSLTEDFRPKVTAITESKDVDSIPVDELVGSLQSYESDLPKVNKSKSIS
ncbi:retrotransposon gag domain-containing protein, partial [Staphylococcus aureus]|nr:retrotransposon gag domain-containing protein [Staphylococcus aureus]